MKDKKSYTALVCLTLGALPMYSQAANWAGGAGNWNDAGQWGGAVPGINDAGNFYSNGTATISDAQNINTSDFGRVGNAAQMDITSSGSLTVGGSGLGGFEGTLWMAWVHSTTGADSSIINVNGGAFQAINVDAGMQRVGDHTAINVNSGGSFLATNSLNWGRNGGIAGFTQDLNVTGIGSSFTVNGAMTLTKGDDQMSISNGATLSAGTLSYDARDNSVFSVGTNSTLILGHNTHTITDGLEIASTGSFSVGAAGSTGTMVLSGMLDIDSVVSGALLFDLGALGVNDKIDMSGNGLTVDNLALADFGFNDVGGAEVGTYTLFEGATITGAVDGSIGVVAGFNAQLVQDGNNINLVLLSPVPEPSSMALLGLGSLALLRRRR